MANPAEVAKAILDRCATLNHGSPVMNIAMPDVAFTPETGEPYFRVDLFSNAPFWQGLKSGRIDQGLLQVTVVWPKGAGVIKPKQAANAVMDHFPKGLTLYGPGVRVRFTGEPWDTTPLIGETETETPVTIPFRV
ncbi:MAG: hypothetical protein EON87_00895 [Brevundimonas sp.]|nr:MAG: hypothetical protein EON87_00895 [Brevundimonas sp.]